MNILIIGGTRRCGPHLIQELVDAGHDVTFYHRGVTPARPLRASPGPASPAAGPGTGAAAREITGDRRDYERFKRDLADLTVDAVIDMVATNAGDVNALVEALAPQKSLRKAVVVSSYEVYRAFEDAWDGKPSTQTVPISEDAPRRTPRHLYPQLPTYDKVEMEQAAFDAFATHGFPVAVLRWPALYGPGDATPREWYYVKQVLDGRTAIPVADGGDALFSRGFVRNMAHSAALLALAPGGQGRAFNAADERAFTNGQIAALAAAFLGRRVEIARVPRRFMPPAPRNQGFPFSCDPYDVRPHLLLDVSRIRHEVGYQDVVQPEEALRLTVEWLRANPAGPERFPVSYEELDRAIAHALS